MSHITTVKLEVKDLEAMKGACEELGLEFREGAAQFRTYGGALTACDHLIAVKGNAQAYEIGLRARGDGSYEVLTDFYGGGRGLSEKVGRSGEKLIQMYGAEVAIRAARKKGLKRVSRTWLPNGRLRVVCA